MKISGTVTMEILEPENQKTKPEANVRFRTDPIPSDAAINELFKMFEENGFPNVEGEKAPSGWRNFLPMLFMLTLIAVLFFFLMKRLGGTDRAMACPDAARGGAIRHQRYRGSN